MLSAETTGANKSFDQPTTANFYLFLISFLHSRHGLQQKVISKSDLASAQSSNVSHSTLSLAVSVLEGPVLGLSGGVMEIIVIQIFGYADFFFSFWNGMG